MTVSAGKPAPALISALTAWVARLKRNLKRPVAVIVAQRGDQGRFQIAFEASDFSALEMEAAAHALLSALRDDIPPHTDCEACIARLARIRPALAALEPLAAEPSGALH